MAVLDVGANLGWLTIYLALLVGAAGRVDAFELPPRFDESPDRDDIAEPAHQCYST